MKFKGSVFWNRIKLSSTETQKINRQEQKDLTNHKEIHRQQWFITDQRTGSKSHLIYQPTEIGPAGGTQEQLIQQIKEQKNMTEKARELMEFFTGYHTVQALMLDCTPAYDVLVFPGALNWSPILEFGDDEITLRSFSFFAVAPITPDETQSLDTLTGKQRNFTTMVGKKHKDKGELNLDETTLRKLAKETDSEESKQYHRLLTQTVVFKKQQDNLIVTESNVEIHNPPEGLSKALQNATMNTVDIVHYSIAIRMFLFLKSLYDRFISFIKNLYGSIKSLFRSNRVADDPSPSTSPPPSPSTSPPPSPPERPKADANPSPGAGADSSREDDTPLPGTTDRQPSKSPK